MGMVREPVVGSGGVPAWIARVAKPKLRSSMVHRFVGCLGRSAASAESARRRVDVIDPLLFGTIRRGEWYAFLRIGKHAEHVGRPVETRLEQNRRAVGE